MTAPAGVGLARVTVVAPTRRMDVALPEDILVAEALPNLLQHAGESAADDGEQHGGWVLRRATGTALEPARNLVSQGVRDGEVLHLVPRRTEWPELEYDDVVEAIAGGARRYGRSWGNVATRRCGLAMAAVVLSLGLVDVLLAKPPWVLPGASALIVAVVFLVVGIALSRALSDAVAGGVVAGCALPYAFVSGFLVTGPPFPVTQFGAPQVLLGCVVLLVFGVIGYFGVGSLSRLFAAAIFVGLLGAVASLICFTSVSAAGAAAIAMTIAIGLMPGYPLLSMRLGKLPVPDLPQRAEDMLEDRPVPKRSVVFTAVTRTDELLTGLLLGTSVLSFCCMVVLVISGQMAAVILAVTAVVALLLRARLFPTPRQRIPLIVSGAAGFALLMIAVSLEFRQSVLILLPLLLAGSVVGAFVLVAGLLFSRRPPSPYLGRFADIFDVVAIIALVPVTCIVCGFDQYVQGLFASIGVS